MTLVDAALLVGLLPTTALVWWWTDPLDGFVIVFYGARDTQHSEPASAVHAPTLCRC